MRFPAAPGLPTLLLNLCLLLASGMAAADQLYIKGVLFRDGDSVVRLLQQAGQPLWVSQIGYRCNERFSYRSSHRSTDRRGFSEHRYRHGGRHGRNRNNCDYRSPAERWTYIDAGKEIRITVVADTIEAIDWKFKGHSW
ncbi:hypothetical protein [Marinobacterium sedimentorum]|uniref:hypothetical protein n=1 Tax=Marinobacterium sedimentorum TaxID=2927804 RepID=UPI0020C7241E|nr:hypothetical protein [Marinobacterium sedimentorum]MCP8689904.1 hypothetical protein [Marinobacterium sedimentorum]